MYLNKVTGQQTATLQICFPNTFFLNFQIIEATYLRMIASLQKFCFPFYDMLNANCVFSEVADWKFKYDIHRRRFSNLCLLILCNVTFDLPIWFNIFLVNISILFHNRKCSVFRRNRNGILSVIGSKTPQKINASFSIYLAHVFQMKPSFK